MRIFNKPIGRLAKVLLLLIALFLFAHSVRGDIYAFWLMITELILLFLPDVFSSEKAIRHATKICENLFIFWLLCCYMWTLYHVKLAM